jgi:glycosyltransferase involved in cell wall biosynthesis
MASTFPRFRGDTMPPFVLRLCQAMQREGWQSLVLAPHAAGLATAEDIEGVACRRFRYAPAGLERLAYGGGMLANVRSMPWLWLVLPFYLLALMLAAGRLLLRERIPVIHAHWIVPQGLVAVLLKKVLFWRELRVVLTAHGGDLHADMGPLGRVMLRWTMRGADTLAVVSEDMRRLAIELGMPAERVVVASMGVDTEAFCPPPPGALRNGLLFVGRLAEKKGVTYLLQAFARLSAASTDLELRIAGDGPLRADLEAEAKALGVAGRVRFLGAQPPAAVPELFRSARLFVMPSVVAASGDQEGLGLVAAEALSCGCPVVAHDLPAVRDLVLQGQTGLMVPPGDVAALAAGIAALLDDPAKAAALAEAGRRHIVNNYGWSSVAQRYRGLYESGRYAESL